MLKRNRFSSVAPFLLGALMLLVAAAGALAQSRSLDAPRAAGTVGERYDGYAVVRAPAAPDVGPLVERVNAERRKVYAEQAQKEKVPVDQVGRVYAAEIFRSAPSGTWFLKEDGSWVRK